MHDYQESATTGQTDTHTHRRRTKWSRCQWCRKVSDLRIWLTKFHSDWQKNWYLCFIFYCSDWQDFQNQSKWLACPKRFQHLRYASQATQKSVMPCLPLPLYRVSLCIFPLLWRYISPFRVSLHTNAIWGSLKENQLYPDCTPTLISLCIFPLLWRYNSPFRVSAYKCNLRLTNGKSVIPRLYPYLNFPPTVPSGSLHTNTIWDSLKGNQLYPDCTPTFISLCISPYCEDTSAPSGSLCTQMQSEAH